MSYKTKEDIVKRMQEHYAVLEDMGYEVVGLFLQGSQNYNLGYEDSDVDTKAIILPTLDDIILNKALDLISQGEYLKKDYFAMENHESSLKENYLLYGAATAGLAGVACLAVMRRGRRR